MLRFGSRAGEFISVVRLKAKKSEAAGKPTVRNTDYDEV
jgi:hypothetical protein